MTGATLVVDGGEWMYRTPLIPREAVSQASRGAYLLIATALELEDAGKVNSLILELFRVENIE